MVKHARNSPPVAAATEPEKDAVDATAVEVAGFLSGKVLPNLHLLIVLLVAILVAVSLLALWQVKRRDNADRAALSVAKAETAESLRGLADKYRGQPVGEQAAFAYARTLFEEKKYADAADAFKGYLAAYPAGRQAAAARLGHAYALEAQGLNTGAQKAFADCADAAREPAAQAEAFLAAGRCAQAEGRTEAARTFYERALGAGADGLVKQEATVALARLAPVPKPVAATPSPAAAPAPNLTANDPLPATTTPPAQPPVEEPAAAPAQEPKAATPDAADEPAREP